MDRNKSIDGLVSRSQKERMMVSRKNVKVIKPVTKPAPRMIKVQKSVVKKAVTKPVSIKIEEPEPIKVQETVEVTESVTIKEPEIPKQTAEEAIEDFLKPVRAFDFDEQSGKLTASKEPNKKALNEDDMKKDELKDKKSGKRADKEKPLKVKKPASKKKKIILSIVAVLLVLILGAGTALLLWGNDIIAKITGGQGNVFDLLTFVDEHYNPLKTDENGRTNILAIGTSGYNMDGDEGEGVHDGAQLTDSIMVISIDQEKGDVAMLSLPRDLKASPTCTATGKINEVYWCNNMNGDNEAAGTTAVMAEVGDILGIEFQYYAHLNWGALVNIVDLLGGITVNLDEPIYDYTYTGAVFEAGEDYEIDGEAALGLARARHGTTSGDFSRGASQQKILVGIKNKISEKKLSISDIMGLAGTLGDNLRTNFSVDEMKTLAHLSAEFDFNEMRQVSLIEPEPLMTTGYINGISYVLPAAGVGMYSDIRNYIEKMFSSDPKIREDASILVLNGTGEAGLASKEQTALKADGYNYVFTDDAPEGEWKEKYALYMVNPEKVGTVKILEEKYGVKAGEELPEGVETEYDFVLILGGAEKAETEEE